MRYYPQSLSYLALRKSLKGGKTKNGSQFIKKFHCNCEKHKDNELKAIVSENTDELIIKRCKWRTTDDGILAINSEGEILISAYQFYSKHFDWKVCAAAAIGLGKLKTEQSIALLFVFLQDSHYGLALAAIQSLEAIGSETILNSLQKFRSENTVNRINRLITGAIERLKFGVNAKGFIKQIVSKLQSKDLLRKVSSQKERKNNVLIPRRIYNGLFNEITLKHCLGSWDVRSREHQTANMLVRVKEEKLLVRTKRLSLSETKQNKQNYMINLFYKDIFLVDQIQNNIHPQSGDVYWAVTDTNDPKTTRPVLVLKAIDKQAGDYLVAPLTSDINNTKGNIIVEVNEKKSCVQLSRQKIVNRYLMLNKYGSLNQNELDKILTLENIGTVKTNRIKKYIAYKKKLYSKATRHCPDKFYKVDITSELLMNNNSLDIKENSLKQEKQIRTNHPIILWDFFKPELRQLIDLEPISQKKNKKKNLSRNTSKLKPG